MRSFNEGVSYREAQVDLGFRGEAQAIGRMAVGTMRSGGSCIRYQKVFVDTRSSNALLVEMVAVKVTRGAFSPF